MSQGIAKYDFNKQLEILKEGQKKTINLITAVVSGQEELKDWQRQSWTKRWYHEDKEDLDLAEQSHLHVITSDKKAMGF